MTGETGGYTNAIIQLFDFVEMTPEQIMSMPQSEILEMLNKHYVNCSVRIEDAQKQFNAMLTKKRLDEARKMRNELENKYLNGTESPEVGFQNVRETLMNYLAQMSSDQRNALAVSYRNFEKENDEDVRSLLTDVEILKKINEEEKNES